MRKMFSLPSENQTTDLALYVWEAQQPVAVMQLIHGMAEYATRYEPFIQEMNRHHITVIAHDHVGHGQSVNPSKKEYGFFAEKQPEHVIISDIIHVAQVAKEAYPDLPFIALGHSMGSFALRCTIEKAPSLYDGVILMGSGYFQPALFLGLPLVDLFDKWRPHAINRWIDALTFGFYPLHYKHEPFDTHSWLSRDLDNRETFKKDPLLGFTFTNNGFYTLFHLVAHSNRTEWFEHYPTNFPTLIISGAEDPIGNYGKGITKVVRRLEEEGVRSLSFRLYDHARHELLNEAIDQTVTNDVWKWIKNNILD